MTSVYAKPSSSLTTFSVQDRRTGTQRDRRTRPCSAAVPSQTRVLRENTQCTPDCVETCSFRDCDRRCVLRGTCVWWTDASHVSTVTLDRSEIVDGYNTADTVV